MDKGISYSSAHVYIYQRLGISSCKFQAKKSGNDLSEEDAKLLEYTSGEQSRLQKQLEALRKQQRAHTQLLQDYKAKQQVGSNGLFK